jgi:Spy/CpxP family protein refolding chaperone
MVMKALLIGAAVLASVALATSAAALPIMPGPSLDTADTVIQVKGGHGHHGDHGHHYGWWRGHGNYRHHHH